METARIILDNDFRIGAVDPRLYGSFVEHLGRADYKLWDRPRYFLGTIVARRHEDGWPITIIV